MDKGRLEKGQKGRIKIRRQGQNEKRISLAELLDQHKKHVISVAVGNRSEVLT